MGKSGELKEAVKTAIASGYRLLDCAYIYGNESEIGEALTEVFQEGSVRREDLFIISKVCDWPTWSFLSDQQYIGHQLLGPTGSAVTICHILFSIDKQYDKSKVSR